MACFDPLKTIAEADLILEEYRLAKMQGQLTASLQQKLIHVRSELELTREFYQLLTPSRMRMALIFGSGVGGLAFMSMTLGLSMLITLASTGLALNDLRDFVDNRGQIRRIDFKLASIDEAIRAF
jgi:hypothetical protein